MTIPPIPPNRKKKKKQQQKKKQKKQTTTTKNKTTTTKKTTTTTKKNGDLPSHLNMLKVLFSQLLFLQNWASNYWVEKGCPRNKLVIGMGLYGRSFTLTNPNSNGLMAPAKSAGQAGKFTREGGFLSYYEVSHFFNRNGQY